LSGPDRLDSWKAIAAYLKRDVRTVRRWEKDQGLPIHRHLHKRLGSVYAYTSELDAWWANESERMPAAPSSQPATDREPPPDGRPMSPPSSRVRWIVGGIAVVLVAIVVVSASVLAGRPRSASTALITQVTFNTSERPVLASAISPDGKYLAYADSEGVVLHTIATRQERRIPIALQAELRDLAWLRDSTSLVLSGNSGIWRTSIFGDPTRQVAQSGGLIAISPDDAFIAVTDAQPSRIRVLSIAGEPVGVAAPEEPRTRFSRSSWSPDSRRIAYIKAVSNPGRMELSLETRHADGTSRTTVFSGRLHSVIWTADGHLLFSQPRPRPKERFSSLWQVRVDAGTGLPTDAPTQITDAPDFTFLTPTATADGGTLAFTVTRPRLDAYLADFDPVHHTLDHTRRAVVDYPDNLPTGWTPRGDAILFVSSRRGPDGIYRQPLDGADPQDFLVTPAAVYEAVPEPGGNWIYYIESSRPTLMRVSVRGGEAQSLFALAAPASDSWIECAHPPAHQCAISGVTNRGLRLTAFDPVSGQPGATADGPPLPSPISWALSPDGRTVASVAAGSPSRIVLTDLATGTSRQREAAAFVNVQTVGWTRDGKGLLITTGSGASGGRIFYVDPNGEPTLIWQSTSQRLWHPLVSPDGRHVAFSSALSESTAWTLKRF
jgi:Tol biopolymer transport system component